MARALRPVTFKRACAERSDLYYLNTDTLNFEYNIYLKHNIVDNARIVKTRVDCTIGNIAISQN